MRHLPVLVIGALLATVLPASAQDPQPPAPQARQHRRGNGDFKQLGLTDEQKQKLQAIRRQYPDDPKARRKAVEEVLTPEQQDKLKELRRHRREMRRAPQPPPSQP
jgi:Spy/CpxP family protein refolding chaperone